MEITVHTNRTFQTFEGFGVSGAWWAQCVGGWDHPDPESGLPVRDRIAELLFSRERGIGLRAYRYNLGAGSARSGRGDIPNPLRRTDCFETAPGVYDFSRDANAVYMLRQAVRYGAEDVILFANSPPERLTKNGMAHCSKNRPFRENLPRENYAAFARYCLDAAAHFLAMGIPVRSVSPVNEPFWVWNGGQEGCHYGPRAAGRLLRVFAEELDRRPELAGVRLSGMENGDIRWFNKSYTRALLRDSRVRAGTDGVDLHSYFLNPFGGAVLPVLGDRIGYLRRFRRWMDRRYPGVPVRVSEWCHMQGGRDPGMDSALVTAKVIYEDLTVLNAAAWQHWIAVSEVDYCDGLIYADLAEKSFSLTKRYFVTGNFSRYIPFGAARAAVTCPDPSLKALAFVRDGRTVLIVINDTETAKTARFPASEATLIVTDAGRDLAPCVIRGEATIAARSVNTILF